MLKPSSIEFRCSIENLMKSTFSFVVNGQVYPIQCEALANNESGWAEKFTFAIPVFRDKDDKSDSDSKNNNDPFKTYPIMPQPNQYDLPIGYMLYELIIGYIVDKIDGDKEVGRLYYELYPIVSKNIIDVVRGNATHFKQTTPDHVAVWFTKFESEDENYEYFKPVVFDKTDFEIFRNTNGLGEEFHDDEKYIEKHIQIMDTFIRDAISYYLTICDFGDEL